MMGFALGINKGSLRELLIRRRLGQASLDIARLLAAFRFYLYPAFVFFNDIDDRSSGNFCDHRVVKSRSTMESRVCEYFVLPTDCRIAGSALFAFTGFDGCQFDEAWDVAFF